MSKTVDAVIYVGGGADTICVYLVSSEKRINIDCRNAGTDVGEKIGAAIAHFSKNHPSEKIARVTFVLDDSFIFTDTLTVPSANKSTTEKALSYACSSIYQSGESTEIKSYALKTGEHRATYVVMGVSKNVTDAIHGACHRARIELCGIISAASSAIYAALSFNSRLKVEAFTLLNIGEEAAKVIFVKDAKPLGTYTIPFGHENITEIAKITKSVIDANSWICDFGKFDKIYVTLPSNTSAFTESDDKYTFLPLCEKAIIGERFKNLELCGAALTKLHQKECGF